MKYKLHDKVILYPTQDNNKHTRGSVRAITYDGWYIIVDNYGTDIAVPEYLIQRKVEDESE